MLNYRSNAIVLAFHRHIYFISIEGAIAAFLSHAFDERYLYFYFLEALRHKRNASSLQHTSTRYE